MFDSLPFCSVLCLLYFQSCKSQPFSTSAYRVRWKLLPNHTISVVKKKKKKKKKNMRVQRSIAEKKNYRFRCRFFVQLASLACLLRCAFSSQQGSLPRLLSFVVDPFHALQQSGAALDTRHIRTIPKLKSTCFLYNLN